MGISSINPANGVLIQSFPPLSDAEVERKLQNALTAFRVFRGTSFAERARLMMRTADILERDKNSLARLMTTEMGKTLRSAVDEAAKCAWACRYFSRERGSLARRRGNRYR